jgi:hypothetical protein
MVWTSKTDLNSTRKCDWINCNDCYEFGHTIEIRQECRCPQKCFLIWNYYVGCLRAPLLVLTHSKEIVFLNQIWCFFTIKTRFWKLLHVQMRKKNKPKLQSMRALVLSLWATPIGAAKLELWCNKSAIDLPAWNLIYTFPYSCFAWS